MNNLNDKKLIIDDLYEILCISSQSGRSFKQRSRGFKAELEFKELSFQSSIKILDGGWVLYKEISPPDYENQAIYITLSLDDKLDYVDVYNIFSSLPEISNCYYCQIIKDNWSVHEINNIEILFPIFNVYKFDKNKFLPSNINEILTFFTDKRSRNYSHNNKERTELDFIENNKIDAIINLYANRFFLDIFLKKKKKEIFDFDAIYCENNQYSILEIKEKFPGNFEINDKNKWFYGWDTRRYAWYLYLTSNLDTDCLYIIREVDNTTQRNFREWKKISIQKFNRSVCWSSDLMGGSGMAGGRSSTLIAPYIAFENLF